MHPILFHISSFAVRSYGVLIMIGFALALRRAMKRSEWLTRNAPAGSPRRINPDDMFDIGFFGLFAGLAGARFLFVLLDWGDYSAHPLSAFAIWEGGMSLHGGLLFGCLYLIWACKVWKKVSLPAISDLCAVSWPLGYAIARIGCLLNGCCYGAPTNLPWGVRFPDENHPGMLTPPSQPIQLYATIINLCFFWWLIRREKRPRRDGELFWIYIALYGAYRFAMEFLREGATSTYRIPSLHITDTHIVSVIMVLMGMIAVRRLRRTRMAYTDNMLPPDRQEEEAREPSTGSLTPQGGASL